MRITPQIFWPYCTAVMMSVFAIVMLARDWRRTRIEWLFALGPICYAIPMAAFGADHLSDARSIMQAVPHWMPGRLFWTYFVGVCLVAAALSIVFRIESRLASLLLGSMLLLFVLLIHIPNAIAKPGDRMLWIYAARDLAFACGAFILGITEGEEGVTEERLLVGMQFVIAAIAVFYGLENVLHPEGVPAVPLEGLTPSWIPLGRLWTSLTGCALILGGVAMFIARTRLIAAEALGIVVLLSVLLLYVPMMIAQPDVDSLNYVLDTLVFAGTFLVIRRHRRHSDGHALWPTPGIEAGTAQPRRTPVGEGVQPS